MRGTNFSADTGRRATSDTFPQISDFEVASIARRLTSIQVAITGQPSSPRNQIVTAKLGALEMTYGGEPLLERTIEQLIRAVAQPDSQESL